VENISLNAPSLDERKAAEILGARRLTLTKWRQRGRGPVYYKLNGAVRYRFEDLQSYLESCRVDPAKKSKSRRRSA
jgi:predicted site-specific integrase-resolvase